MPYLLRGLRPGHLYPPLLLGAHRGGPFHAFIDIISEELEEKLGIKKEFFKGGFNRLGLKPEDIGAVIHYSFAQRPLRELRPLHKRQDLCTTV